MKSCFKCGEHKPLDEFYKHSKMADGRLGKCKECTKLDVARHRAENSERINADKRRKSNTPEHRARNRKNYRKRISTPEGRAREWERARKYRNGTKRAAHIILGNAINGGKVVKPSKCSKCGAGGVIDGHHENYFEPLVVIWLCKLCHGARHREINEAIRNGEDWSDRGF